jgi:hypothetical protein
MTLTDPRATVLPSNRGRVTGSKSGHLCFVNSKHTGKTCKPTYKERPTVLGFYTWRRTTAIPTVWTQSAATRSATEPRRGLASLPISSELVLFEIDLHVMRCVLEITYRISYWQRNGRWKSALRRRSACCACILCRLQCPLLAAMTKLKVFPTENYSHVLISFSFSEYELT